MIATSSFKDKEDKVNNPLAFDDFEFFRAPNIETARAHWFDSTEVGASFGFSEAALAP